MNVQMELQNLKLLFTDLLGTKMNFQMELQMELQNLELSFQNTQVAIQSLMKTITNLNLEVLTNEESCIAASSEVIILEAKTSLDKTFVPSSLSFTTDELKDLNSIEDDMEANLENGSLNARFFPGDKVSIIHNVPDGVDFVAGAGVDNSAGSLANRTGIGTGSSANLASVTPRVSHHARRRANNRFPPLSQSRTTIAGVSFRLLGAWCNPLVLQEAAFCRDGAISPASIIKPIWVFRPLDPLARSFTPSTNNFTNPLVQSRLRPEAKVFVPRRWGVELSSTSLTPSTNNFTNLLVQSRLRPEAKVFVPGRWGVELSSTSTVRQLVRGAFVWVGPRVNKAAARVSSTETRATLPRRARRRQNRGAINHIYSPAQVCWPRARNLVMRHERSGAGRQVSLAYGWQGDALGTDLTDKFTTPSKRNRRRRGRGATYKMLRRRNSVLEFDKTTCMQAPVHASIPLLSVSKASGHTSMANIVLVVVTVTCGSTCNVDSVPATVYYMVGSVVDVVKVGQNNSAGSLHDRLGIGT